MTTGIGALCGALKAAGIEVVFGVPGTQTVYLFEGLRRSRIRTVLASSELAAAFMANGYYRASGRIAAVVTIPGPGFTFALTGIAEARADSAGLLFLVGKATDGSRRQYQLQAIDQRGIALGLVKDCLEVNAAGEAVNIIRRAHEIAAGGEPGPVLIELNLAALAAAVPDAAKAPSGSVLNVVPELGELGDLFDAARRPVLLLGQGAFACSEKLQRLAESLLIPVVTTASGRGIVPEDSHVVLGFDSVRGGVGDLNALLDDADLMLGLGCKLSHNGSAGYRLRLAPERFVHVDTAKEVLGANYPARLKVAARVESVIDLLCKRMRPTDWNPEAIRVTRSAVRRTVHAAEPVVQADEVLAPRDFFAQLRSALRRDAIVVTDSGQHQVLTRRYFDVLSPRGLIVPSDFQSMGYGLPAAIGASLANPERQVVAIVGDGGFLMSAMDLLTARREELRLCLIVFNDGHLGQIRTQQLAEYGHTHAVDLATPDFAVFAESVGARYFKFGDHGSGDLARFLEQKGDVALIEVPIGDSAAIRRVALRARTKSLIRRILDDRLTARIKALLPEREDERSVRS